MAREVFQLEDVRLVEEENSVPALSADAKQRFVFSPSVAVVEPSDTLPLNPNDNIPLYAVNKRQIICAEPSPDALTALAARLDGSVDVSGFGGSSAQAGVDFSRSIRETVQSLGERTQTIQLIRDTLYRACEAYANGALDTFGYTLILGAYERFTMQSLGIDALSRRGPTTSAQEALVEGATQELQIAESKLIDAEAALALAARSDDAATRESARSGGQLSLAVESAKIERSEAVARRNAALLALRRARGREDAGGGSSSDIVEIAKLPSGPNGGSRAVSAACLMWFARNPNVRSIGGGGQLELRPDSPAIAFFCKDILDASLAGARQQAADAAKERELRRDLMAIRAERLLGGDAYDATGGGVLPK